MMTLGFVALITAGMVSNGTLVHAQKLTKGTLSGTVVTATATAPNQGAQVTVFTTPGTGQFVLTQLCVFRGQNEDTLSGGTLGGIARSLGDNSGLCTTYTPGLAIPQNEDLNFQDTRNDAEDSIVTITGVLSKK